MLPLYLAKYEMWQNDKLIIGLRYSLFYLKINDTVKLVKLSEKIFIWAQLFLIKIPRGVVSIDQCCCWQARGNERGVEGGAGGIRLGNLGSVVSSPSGVWGSAPVQNEFGAFWRLQEAADGGRDSRNFVP